MTQEEIKEIRRNFPILDIEIYKKPLIYFDNAATTQKPIVVLNSIEKSYRNLNANIHRGVHYLSQKATVAHEDARQYIATFLNAHSSSEIIFTRGTTESINLLATTFGEAFCSQGDEVIISAMEHHSNIVPWQMMCERRGAKLKIVPINEKGELILEEYLKLLNSNTKIVAITHISNVLGTINPIKYIIAEAHKRNVPVLIDAAQSIPHIKVDVQELDVDFLAFSGHKVYAPNGIGVLYGKEKWLKKIPPYHGGGEMIKKVTFEKTTYSEPPFKFEAGTPDYVGSVALATALKYVSEIGIEKISDYENELTRYAIRKMGKIANLKFYGTAKEKSSVISFLIGEIHPYDLGMILDKMGIAVRTGHHCAEPLMELLGISGTVRASFSFYNTVEEIDIFVDSLNRAIDILS